MWADDLGNGNYQIKNIPFYAYGIHYDDIVFAMATSTEEKPEIKKLVKANGHQTLRILFIDDETKEEHIKIIESIRTKHIGYEGMSDNLFALNVTPEGDFDGLHDALELLEKRGILHFETCEARVEGGFDDAPVILEE